MYYVNKISLAEPIDFAASELKKYLRMMMPEGGDVKITYAPDAKEGFRLGLMQDFGLDVSDVENTELDDIIYIDCDEKGGILAGDFHQCIQFGGTVFKVAHTGIVGIKEQFSEAPDIS